MKDLLTMEKLDLRKELKYLYAPSAKKVEVVDVPELQFAMIDGHIEPGQMPGTSGAFQEAVGALYGVSYTLKFMSKLRQKRPNPAIDRLRLAPFHEGLCMQIMHLGPYADEPQTVARMKEFAQAHGYEPAGKHHEIYLGDPLRSAPEKLKTILRQPVRPAEA